MAYGIAGIDVHKKMTCATLGPDRPGNRRAIPAEGPAREGAIALGASLGVAVRIEGAVDRPPESVTFTNMDTTVALNLLCKNAGCTWEFDEGAGELRVRFNAR